MNAVISPHLVIKRGWLNLRTGFVHILCVGCLTENVASCYEWKAFHNSPDLLLSIRNIHRQDA